MQSARREMELHAAKVAEFELKRKMRSMVVPTDDVKVRQMLRQLEQPITLFGEREVRGVATPYGTHAWRKMHATARQQHDACMHVIVMMHMARSGSGRAVLPLHVGLPRVHAAPARLRSCTTVAHGQQASGLRVLAV